MNVRDGRPLVMTVVQLAERAGVTYHQIKAWCVAGYLKPDGGGVGHPYAFPPAEVEIALRMVRLIEAGLTVPAAGQVARGEGDLGGGILVLVLNPDTVATPTTGKVAVDE